MPMITREMARRTGAELEMPLATRRSRRPVNSVVPGDAVPAESSPRGNGRRSEEGADAVSQEDVMSVRSVESVGPGDEVPAEISPRSGRHIFEKVSHGNSDNGSVRTFGRRTGSSRIRNWDGNSVKTMNSSQLRRKLRADEEWAELERKVNEIKNKELELANAQLQLKKQDLIRQQELVRSREEVEDAESQKLSDDDELYEAIKIQREPVTEQRDAEVEDRIVAKWVNESTTSPLDALTLALTNAFRNIIPVQPVKSTPTADMKQFLARQSTGKELPTFSGDPEDWQFFYTTLTRTTKLCGFSEDENIARLQKCLKGKAKEAVQAMLVSTCSFDEIVETLKKRFGRPKVIIKSLVEKARKVVKPSEDDPESLLDFAITVKNLCSSAESLKQAQYLSNPQLMEELLLKLPAHMRMEWGRTTLKKAEEDITLKDFSNFLDEVASVAARISAVSSTESTPSSTADTRPGNPKKKSHEKNKPAYVVTEEIISCVCGCRKKHDLAACEKFKKLTVRERWLLVKQSKLCYGCLNGGHSNATCPLKKQCDQADCDKTHHRLLHFEQKKKEKDETPVLPNEQKAGFSGNVQRYPYDDVLMRVLPVRLSGPRGSLVVNAFLDEGSSVSMIDGDLAVQLGLKGKKKPLNLSWINGNSNADSDSMSVSMKIAGVSSSDDQYRITNVRTVKNLYLPAQPLETYKMREAWNHLVNVPFVNIGPERPKILLGQDNIHLTVPRKVVEGHENAPMATLTKLGWVVHGKTVKSEDGETGHVSFAAFHHSHDDELHEIVKEQFRLDALGVMIEQKLPRSKEDERAEKLMEDCTKRVGDHWETGLLWKEGVTSMPDSKSAAYRRLKILEKQMDKDPEFAELYCKKIDEYVEKGFCHELSASELAMDNGKVWYLPHFGATNPNKPGKLRLVFDCAAKVNGISLNDALLQGPDLMTPLIDVLGRFRQKEVGFSGDIRDMFHMVRMRQEDLPSLRFLWRGKDRSRPPRVWTMDVMVFGAVTSPYQAQWVKNQNGEDFREEYSSTVDAIVDNHYVDDYLDSESTEDDACVKIAAIKDIHQKGGFEIRNWLCSSEKVLQTVAPEEVQQQSELELSGEDKLERVLGLYWNPKGDTFHFKMRFRTVGDRIVSGEKTPTKREILKLVMCLFDPLGFLAHLTVRAKILMQDIWRIGLGWDDEIPASVDQKWIKFLDQLRGITNVSIPRCYAPFISNASDIQLHVFCDASEQAYCAVAYLRVSYDGRGADPQNVFTNIVIAKTRVTPLRPTSIPRLELQAALIGSRLVAQVKKSHEIKIGAIHMWTDSKTALCWIRARDPRSFKPYVSHRIGEIQEHTDASMWKWVPTKENVADEGTRDVISLEFAPDSRWFVGPSFLRLPEDDWPQEGSVHQPSDEILEVRGMCGVTVPHQNLLVDISRFSDWMKLLRVTGWCIRFVKNFVAKFGKKPNWNSRCGPLQCLEIKSAELMWIQQVQRESFGAEMSALEAKKNVDKSSRLQKLSPMLVDGIIRIEGRIQKSPDVPFDTKSPILLDPKHEWTKLLIDFYHKAAGHHGMEVVFNELRQRYWILDMRTAIRSVWKTCQRCRLDNAKPIIPQMAPLPEVRVTRVPRPFTNVGVDYFGPIEVVSLRRTMKRWGVIFTCLSTRAIHLEVSHSLSTDSFIMALERFISRRGEPEIMLSDNGTNFKGAEKELRLSLKAMDQEKIMDKMTRKGITWKFIPPSAPHMGGAWERLIRCVKVSLNAVMKTQRLSDEVLLTVLAEAEAVVNSRPLTFVSSDKDDPEALTPNCFLMGTTSIKQPPGVFSDEDLSLRKKWRIAECLADHFWKRWTKEYLPTLSIRKKWHCKTGDMKIGDLVFVADSNLPRNIWPKGLVVGTFPGKDGKVRVVDVKTANGVLRRPVIKLYRIEVDQPLE